MKLRLRGAVRADWDWDQRTPSVGEMFKIDGDWFRVTQVLWAVTTDKPGWDAGLVLHKSNAPDESEWVKADA